MLRQLIIIALALTPSLGLAQIPDSNADLNGDAITNSLDFSLLAGCFGQHPATNTACAVADVDTDGAIDVNDFVFVSARFGQAYPWTLFPLPTFSVDNGTNTSSIYELAALGDLNGDNVLDLVVPNRAGNDDLAVLLGNGDGSFKAQQRFAAGYSPQSVALGDINGDGELDIAVVNRSQKYQTGTETVLLGNVSVLLGNGDGSFQAQKYVAAIDDSQILVLGDVNGDDVLDLAVTSSDQTVASSDVSVLLGNGDGSFQSPQRVATGDFAGSIILGDTNGDAALDLMIAFGEGGLAVLLGNGDGSFQVPQRVAAGDYPQSILFEDVNGDSVPDLVAANETSNDVSVLLGNGDGSFRAQQVIAAGGREPRLTALDDFDGDGTLDLVVMVLNGENPSAGSRTSRIEVSVLLGNKDGSFQTPQLFFIGRGFSGLSPTSVDVNGDNLLDLVYIKNSTLSILPGSGDGSFQPLQRGTTEPAEEVALGDLNGDGVLDMAVINSGDSVGYLSVMLGSGDGSFQPPQMVGDYGYLKSLVLADLNGDNLLDLAVINAGYPAIGVLIMLGNGDGSFQTQQVAAAGLRRLSSLTLEDLNGDDVLDLAVTQADPSNTGGVLVLLGNGDGSFQASQRVAAARNGSPLVLGDMNGDDVLDLAVVESGDTAIYVEYVTVLLGNGDGSFQTRQRVTEATPSFDSVGLADLNSDNVLDLTFASGRYREFSVMPGGGDGSFQAQQRIAVSNSPQSPLFDDINGDGAIDLVYGGVSVLLGNGDASFRAEQRFTAGESPASMALGDLNGDAVLDIAVASAGGVTLLIGKRNRR